MRSRITFLFLFYFLTKSFAFQDDHDKVSLELLDTPLRTALEMLSQQTDLDFVYGDELVKNIRVTCKFVNAPIMEVLKEILLDTSITFRMNDDRVVLMWRRRKTNVMIHGRVLDKATGLPLDFVNVFIAYSTFGDATNKNGEFIIPHVPLGTFELVVSMIGYAVLKREISVVGPVDEPLILKLTPQPYQAPEILVSAADMKKWRKNLKKFSKIFFSTTQNASECKILNPLVLDFANKKRGVLTATANEPLIIENRALGYKLSYILEEFEASRVQILYAGLPRFELLTPESPDEEKKWKRNRARAYRGSLRHFLTTLCKNYFTVTAALEGKKKSFRSLYGKTLYESPNFKERKRMPEFRNTGFQVLLVKKPWHETKKQASIFDAGPPGHRPRGELTNINEFLSPGPLPHQMIFKFPYYLEVTYANEMEEENYLDYMREDYRAPSVQKSLLTLETDSLLIVTSGHFLPYFGLRTYGYWSWEGIADGLPLDYTHSEAEVDK